MLHQFQELERKLAEEIKCRDRAQKKLKYAMKKLESMKAFDGLRGQMDKPMRFVGSSSSQCCLGRQTFEGETSGSLTVDSGQGSLSEDVKRLLSSSGSQGIPETSPEESAHQLFFLEESWTSAKKVKSQCEVPETVEKDKGFSPEEWEICHLRYFFFTILQEHEELTSINFNNLPIQIFFPQKLLFDLEHREESSAQDCESENNVLALVPTGKSIDPEVDNPEVEDDVESVLLSLRKVKEQLIQSLKLTSGVYSSKMHFC